MIGSLLWYALIVLLVVYALSFFFESFACITYKLRLMVKGAAHMAASVSKAPRWCTCGSRRDTWLGFPSFFLFTLSLF